MTKTVLCYGDSNTWGFDPVSIGNAPFPIRFPRHVRWTGVLARLLGDGVHVIEEGLNGRTTVFDDPLAAHRNGAKHLPACLESHQPIDLVVLMLGTNDLKRHFATTPTDIADGAALLGRMVLGSTAGPGNAPPRLLLACPASLGDMSRHPWLAERFPDGIARSRRLPELYAAAAGRLGCGFFDAQPHAAPSPQDGVHWEAAEHARFGAAIADAVRAALA
jgi:lysophospholipase L1-like esterase